LEKLQFGNNSNLSMMDKVHDKEISKVLSVTWQIISELVRQSVSPQCLAAADRTVQSNAAQLCPQCAGCVVRVACTEGDIDLSGIDLKGRGMHCFLPYCYVCACSEGGEVFTLT